MEFLFSAYSVFKVIFLLGGLPVIDIRHGYRIMICSMSCQVIRTDFTVQDWSKNTAHYTIAVEAMIDNQNHPRDIPLAPWS